MRVKLKRRVVEEWRQYLYSSVASPSYWLFLFDQLLVVAPQWMNKRWESFQGENVSQQQHEKKKKNCNNNAKELISRIIGATVVRLKKSCTPFKLTITAHGQQQHLATLTNRPMKLSAALPSKWIYRSVCCCCCTHTQGAGAYYDDACRDLLLLFFFCVLCDCVSKPFLAACSRSQQTSPQFPPASCRRANTNRNIMTTIAAIATAVQAA